MKRFSEKNFPSVQTPGIWLSGLLKARGLGQNQLARILDIDRGRISKMINGREPMPDYEVDLICEYMGIEDRSTPSSLVSIKMRVESLWEYSAKFLQRAFPDDWEAIVVTLLSSVEKSTDRMIPGSGRERLQYINLYLAHALHAARCIARAAKDESSRDGAGYLFTKEDGVNHVCFPMNVLIGDVLELFKLHPGNEVMRTIFDGMRLIAEERRHEEGAADFARQHAIHMLSRHGGEEDTQYLADSLRSTDLPTRRMAVFGQMLKNRDNETVDRVIYEIRNNDYFRDTVIRFDAVHYRDITPHDFLNPVSLNKLQKASAQVMSQIVVSTEETMVDFNIEKLLCIIGYSGVCAFSLNRNSHLLQMCATRVMNMKRNIRRQEFIDTANSMINSLGL